MPPLHTHAIGLAQLATDPPGTYRHRRSAWETAFRWGAGIDLSWKDTLPNYSGCSI